MVDPRLIRKDFPILQQRIDGKSLVYLDSTATSLKPRSVIDAVINYYSSYSANINRGIYKISERATVNFEESRKKTAEFIGAVPSEIIFTRNATESINLVKYSWAKQLSKSDEIITTILEHHSNFVPWQQLGCKFKIWKTDKTGQLNIRDLDTLLTRKTKLLAITAVSNVTGTINPISDIVKMVKRVHSSCIILIDAAQATPHMPINVREWGADFVAFSSHKMLGPTGIGVLWGRHELLESMPPFMYGGDMIREVHEDRTVFNDVPQKFESGTPHIAGVIGLGVAVDYLSNLGMDAVRAHEQEITSYALQQLKSIKDLTVVGPDDPRERGGVVAFTMKGIHPHDIAQILDEDNICIRVGYHCAQPLHEFFGIGSTARASFYVYTTKQDVDSLVKGLEKVKKVFA